MNLNKKAKIKIQQAFTKTSKALDGNPEKCLNNFFNYLKSLDPEKQKAILSINYIMIYKQFGVDIFSGGDDNVKA